jgi:hypothetical protein
LFSLLLRARSLVIYFIIFDPIGGALNIIEAKKTHLRDNDNRRGALCCLIVREKNERNAQQAASARRTCNDLLFQQRARAACNKRPRYTCMLADGDY